MRFQATHKLVTYLLVLAAFATLASCGAVQPVMAAIFLGLVAVSWSIDAGGTRAAAFDRRLTLARVLVGAVLVQRTWVVARQLPEPDLLPVVDFVLLALGAKLCYRRNNRDDVHIFVLSFLLVLAAAAMGGSFLFGPSFVAYVVIATWALVLFHLRREMEENYLVKHSSQAPSQKVGVARILNSRRVVGGAFFVTMGAVALAVAAGAIATFALVPRVGAGFVFGASRAASAVVGFSDDVSLGRHGTLATTATSVALRATLPDVTELPTDAERARAVEGLYWRGTVYDRYDRGHWTRSRHPALRTVLGETHGLVVIDDGGAAPRHPMHRSVIRQEIDIAGSAAFVAFALDRPVAFDVAPRGGASSGLQLVARWSDEVGLRAVPPGAALMADAPDDGRPEPRAAMGTHYVALSTTPPAHGGTAPALPPEVLAASLELPDSLSPRVRELARRLAAGAPPGAALVHAVTSWLRDTHQYTLNLPRPAAGMDPVESFLFETPSGHCEYFASAAAVLLRAAGIPTRYVNGYLGGEWNALGKYVTVRDNRAHSWVEAYLPESGWTRVDATPTLPAAARAGRVRQLFDALDFKWSRFVVGYDLSRQMDLVHRVARGLGVGSTDEVPPASGRRFPGWALVVAAVAAFALAASRVWPTRKPRGAPAPTLPASAAPVQRLYARALERLARAGLPRGRAETPREYATRIKEAGADGDATLAELTELYTAARFGGRPVERDKLRSLARRLGRRSPAAAA